MLTDLSEQDRSERDAIIAEIHAAFAGVTRGERGISWNECNALDDYEPEDVCEAARRSDTDKHWSELVDNPTWEPFPGNGGFSFINAEGFIYYLPPTMIRFLRNSNTEWYPGHLLGEIERFTEQHLLSIWSESQLRCISRFIDFIARHDDERHLLADEPNPWSEALSRRWNTHLPK